MQKALQQMNVRLSPTVTDITGVTGMAIIRAILAGEREPVKLAALAQSLLRSTGVRVRQGVDGQLSRRACLCPQASAWRCMTRTPNRFASVTRSWNASSVRSNPSMTMTTCPPWTRPNKRNTHSKNAPAYDGRSLLYRLLGVDLVAVHGLNEVTAQIIISEIGTDMTSLGGRKAFLFMAGVGTPQ